MKKILMWRKKETNMMGKGKVATISIKILFKLKM